MGGVGGYSRGARQVMTGAYSILPCSTPRLAFSHVCRGVSLMQTVMATHLCIDVCSLSQIRQRLS